MKFATILAAVVALGGAAQAQTLDGTSTSTATSGSGAVSGSTANGNGVNSTVNSSSTSNSGSASISGSTSTSTGANTSSTANTGPSSATTGASTATTGPSTSNAANQGNSFVSNNNFNSSTPAHQSLATAPQIYAPSLSTTLTETCMGSASVGISVVGGGGTIGKTYTDTQCVRRLNARELANQGWHAEACEVLLGDPEVAKAFGKTGRTCEWTPPPAYMSPPPVAQEALPPPPPPPPPAGPVNPSGQMSPIPNPEPGDRG